MATEIKPMLGSRVFEADHKAFKDEAKDFEGTEADLFAELIKTYRANKGGSLPDVSDDILNLNRALRRVHEIVTGIKASFATEVDDLKARTEKAEEKYNEAKSKLTDEKEALKEANAKLIADLTEANAAKEKAEKSFSLADSEKAQLLKLTESQQARLQEYEAKRELLETQASEATVLKELNEGLKESRDKLEAQVGELKSEIEGLRQEHKMAKTNWELLLSKEQENSASLQAALSQTTKDFSDAIEKLNSTKIKLSGAEEKANQLSQRLDECVEDRKELKATEKELRTSEKTLHSEISNLKKELGSLSNQLVTMESRKDKEISDLKKQLKMG